MKVILLERVERLGSIGDVVSVKDGFARNFLLPRSKALRASSTNLKVFEAQRGQIEARNAEAKAAAEKAGTKLDGETYVMIRSAGESGQLYGSVSGRDVADAILSEGGKVDRSQVVLDKPIKTLGVQLYLYRMDAQGLDRLVQHHHRAVDLAAALIDDVGHVAAGDRTVQLTALAGLADQDIGRSVQALAGLGRGFAGLGVAGFDIVPLAFEYLEVGRGGAQGLGAGQQEVAGEPVLHIDHVAQNAQALDPFEQNDFHDLDPPHFTT